MLSFELRESKIIARKNFNTRQQCDAREAGLVRGFELDDRSFRPGDHGSYPPLTNRQLMKRVKVFRTLSQVSAAILAMHFALLAVYLRVGMVLGILDPQFFETFGKALFMSGLVTLSVFCLSTQFYRGLTKQDGD